MSLRLFPDVNVWVALHHQAHTHHERALEWFEQLDPQSSLVFCRQTQIGLFHLLTSAMVMGDEVLTQRQCWTLYQQWISAGKASLQSEPIEVAQTFEQHTTTDSSSPKEWVDAYLAAFAETAGLTLVTFDRTLAGKTKGAVLLG
jgi:toxin-antitoxin system PIN domain toxin